MKTSAFADEQPERHYFQRTYPSKESYPAFPVATEMDDYIRITTWFVREVLDAYENWNEKDNVPMKLQELIMVLQTEVSHPYKQYSRWKVHFLG